MFILDAVNKALEIVLSGAVTTNQLPFTTSYVDVNATTQVITPGAQDGVTNNTTAIIAMNSPAAGSDRRLAAFTVTNSDTSIATVTIRLNNNTTIRQILKITLAVGDQIVISQRGIEIFDSNGNIKTTSSGGGGGGTPGGISGQLQGNSAGSFAGVANSVINFTTGAIQQQSAVVSVTATSKTLALTDNNTIQDCNNSATQTITIPLNASVAFPVNAIIVFEQNGTGQVTLAGVGGVTLTGGTLTGGQGTSMYARQESVNNWILEGGVQPNTAISGTTAGTVTFNQPFQTPQFKMVYGILTGYENNSATNQTLTWPTPFSNTPIAIGNTTGLTITPSTTGATIVSTNSTTVYNGQFGFMGA